MHKHISKNHIALACAFVLYCSPSLAENINYTGNSADLVTAPANNASISITDDGIVPSVGASSNNVTIAFTPITTNTPYFVMGGFAYDSTDNANITSGNNVVTIQQGNVRNHVYGGLTDAFSTAGATTQVNNNTVNLQGNAAVTNVYAGYNISSGSITTGATTGTVTGNTINLYGSSSAAQVIAGYTKQSGYNSNSNVSGNTVNLYDNSTVTSITGGFSQLFNHTTGSSSANNNTVNIYDNVIVSNNILGGRSLSVVNSTTNGNTVNIYGNTLVKNYTYGGFASSTLNTAATSATANKNAINVYGNATIQNSLIGGVAFVAGATSTASAIENTITISGNVKFERYTGVAANMPDLVGGTISTGTPSTFDVFTGNTLNFSTQHIQVRTLGNFEYYNFVLPAIAGGSTTPLISAADIFIDSAAAKDGGQAVVASQVKVAGIQSGPALQAGDQFILMQASNAMTGTAQTGTSTIKQGISLEYAVKVEQDNALKQITATILGGSAPGQVAPELQALSEGNLAGLLLNLQGADMLSNMKQAYYHTETRKSFVPFINVSGDHSRYNSGSHINSDSFSVVGGLSYLHNDLSVGVFAEGGWGDYDSYNSFTNGINVHGNGDTEYYGAGVLAQYKMDTGMYVEGSIRAGKTKTSFDTHDIVSPTGVRAQYDIKSDYVGGHAGVGYEFDVNEKSSLDFSVKYLWTRVDGTDTTVAGDPIHFAAMNSSRIRTTAMWNHQYNAKTKLNASLGYEHEMDAKAKATTYHIYNIKAPDVKGGTVILGAGATIKPQLNANGKGLYIDINGRGYAGKREGVGATLQFNYLF